MKKFYLCKLCLIVFGALLAVQSALAESLQKITPEQVTEAESKWLEATPKKWVCMDTVLKTIKIKLSFDSSFQQVSFEFRNALGDWYTPKSYPVTLDRPNNRAYWHTEFNGRSTYLTGLSLKTGRLEEFSLRRIIGEYSDDTLIKAGRILYACASD